MLTRQKFGPKSGEEKFLCAINSGKGSAQSTLGAGTNQSIQKKKGTQIDEILNLVWLMSCLKLRFRCL